MLFVCGADFRGPSEKQALAFASGLLRRGHAAMISIGGDIASAHEEGVNDLEGLVVRRHRFLGPRLHPADVGAARTFRPDIVHAFNSRHPVIAAARSYANATGARVLVHFEDDEWGLARDPDEIGRRLWLERRARRVAGLLWPRAWTYSTPRSLEWTRRHATALDAVTPALAEHVRGRLGRDCAVLVPMVAALDSAPEPPPPLPAGLEDRALVIFTGAIYPAHVPDVRLGLRAVAILQQRGLHVGFLQCGAVAPSIDPDALARDCGIAPGSAYFLGHLPSGRARALLQRADVLIQPGRPTEFNRLRLPAKLHPYLASGKPTITFGSGFGDMLEDGREVLKTHTGEPAELADRIASVLEDPELRRRLAENGPRAAARLFDPIRNTDALIEHYRAHGHAH